MHSEILSEEQKKLLPVIKAFSKEFYLIGETAIALHLGHRQSIDFDLFKRGKLKRKSILNKIEAFNFHTNVTRNTDDHLDVIVQGVKFTFFEYPFKIEAKQDFDKIIKIPDLLTLAAIKAYALGRRSKWKDYVDLYFILKEQFDLAQISQKAIAIFEDLFSEKQFRAQLSFFEDVDFSEQIDFYEDRISEDSIKNFLTEVSTKLI
jgi:hypothetical protein